jgi:hypothetical protein
MKDDEDGSTYEEVRFSLKVLTDNHRKLIMEVTLRHHVETIFMGCDDHGVSFEPVNTKDIFVLRGMDGNTSMLPQGFHMGAKRAILIIEKEYFTAENFELSLPEATARDAGQLQANKTTAPPMDKCINIRFHSDIQAPHIEFLASSAHSSTRKTTWVSRRLSAQDFDWRSINKHSSLVPFKISKYELNNTVDKEKPSDEPGRGGQRMLGNMSRSFQRACVRKEGRGRTARRTKSSARSCEGLIS